jgi:thioesterase domain-containing protein
VILDSMPPTGTYAAVPADELARHAFAAFASALGVTDRFPVLDTHGDLELAVHSLAALLAVSGEPITGAMLNRRWHTYLRHTRAVNGYRRDDVLDTAALVVAARLADEQVAAWSERLPQVRLARVEADHHGVLRGAAVSEVAVRIVELGAAAS